jgi:S-adenosylmethionine:tRNA ribosyltransferase-isomerase
MGAAVMTAVATPAERFTFDVPEALEASEPPEARGLTRDSVRMLVSYRESGDIVPSSFIFLPRFLEPGDLVVINTSGTLPAAIDATTADGTPLVVHLSTQLDEARWVVELRRIAGRTTERWIGAPPSPRLELAGTASMTLEHPYGDEGRLWTARLDLGQRTLSWLAAHGRPIRYGYVNRKWPIEMYQNVYAIEPGSAEMPSAGRPFTPGVITRLVAKGIDVAPLVLHTGVASLEADELPYPERVQVPESTAERVNAAHGGGHRVIAVGTTVVRALETAALDTAEQGESIGGRRIVGAYDGWTDLVITAERGVQIVDGMITGWHEPASSHLMMLDAIAGRQLLADSYRTALAEGYRWHEFGDVHLILP